LRRLQNKNVIVLAAIFGQGMPHGISRDIPSQNSSPFQEYLKKHDVDFLRDLLFKSNQRPYIKAGVFLDDIGTVLKCRTVCKEKHASPRSGRSVKGRKTVPRKGKPP
jgi:hypothetical protein